MPHRHPEELTTREGERLIERVSEFGSPPPLFVLTGGDRCAVATSPASSGTAPSMASPSG